MPEQNQEANENITSVFKASWMRSSIKLGLIATIAGLIVIGLLKFFDVAGTQMFSDISGFFLNYGLLGIFFVTIIAGTIVPLGSPALVVAAALFGINPVLLVFTTTLGFTIGMTINYVLAYRLGRPYVQKRVSPEHLEEITRYWNKYGWIIYIVFGLIPVLPVELLAFICGFLKTRITTFLILSFIPRLVIFAILVQFGQQVGNWLGTT
jgi:membrane protein YqaA with SNARE-associated domain